MVKVMHIHFCCEYPADGDGEDEQVKVRIKVKVKKISTANFFKMGTDGAKITTAVRY